MAAKVGDFSLILKLLGGIIIGALLGLYIGENAEGSLKHVMDVVVSLRHIFGQIIFFLVPLVIVGFITPAIVRLGQNASKILLVAVALAYVSSLGAALFSMISGYCIIPNLSIATSTETLRSLPEMVFRLDIPPLFSMIHDSSESDWEEMYEVFNMGHRFEIYTTENYAGEIIGIATELGVDAKIVGHVEAHSGHKLTIQSPFGTFVY